MPRPIQAGTAWRNHLAAYDPASAGGMSAFGNPVIIEIGFFLRLEKGEELSTPSLGGRRQEPVEQLIQVFLASEKPVLDVG